MFFKVVFNKHESPFFQLSPLFFQLGISLGIFFVWEPLEIPRMEYLRSGQDGVMEALHSMQAEVEEGLRTI